MHCCVLVVSEGARVGFRCLKSWAYFCARVWQACVVSLGNMPGGGPHPRCGSPSGSVCPHSREAECRLVVEALVCISLTLTHIEHCPLVCCHLHTFSECPRTSFAHFFDDQIVKVLYIFHIQGFCLVRVL